MLLLPYFPFLYHNITSLLSFMTLTYAPLFQSFTLTAVTYVKARHNDVYIYICIAPFSTTNTASFSLFVLFLHFYAEHDRNVCTIPAKIVSGRYQTVFPRYELVSISIPFSLDGICRRFSLGGYIFAPVFLVTIAATRY